jgi:hypothetical protein
VPEGIRFPIPISDNKEPSGARGKVSTGTSTSRVGEIVGKTDPCAPGKDSDPNVTSGGASGSEETAPFPGSRSLKSPLMRLGDRPVGNESEAGIGGVMLANIFDTKLSIKLLGLTVVGWPKPDPSPESSPPMISGRGVELPDRVSVWVPAEDAPWNPKALIIPSKRLPARLVLLVAAGD